MEKAGRGTLVIIGSVAGDRGRAINYTYGASKGFIERYAQGLDHRLAPKGIRVVLAKPGPTDTQPEDTLEIPEFLRRKKVAA